LNAVEYGAPVFKQSKGRSSRDGRSARSEDDRDSDGALTILRDSIRRSLRGQLGRAATDLNLFQDVVAIPYGAEWEKAITESIGVSTFFIPIITPTAVNSENCQKEFELFRAREAELRRQDLIFPILYIPVMALKYEVKRRQSDVLKVIHARQCADWTRFRRQRVNSVEFATEIDNFCRSICDTLHKPPVSLDERRQQQDENRHTERSQHAGENNGARLPRPGGSKKPRKSRRLAPLSTTCGTRFHIDG
jgi:hypothetical protein